MENRRIKSMAICGKYYTDYAMHRTNEMHFDVA
jgi:hypothetical protein